jgi:hypothetical protein
MTENIDIPIDINDFDYHYYLKNNNDLIKAKMNSLVQCYTHWLNHGCYENRKVRSIKTGKEFNLNLNKNQKLIKFNKLEKLKIENKKINKDSKLENIDNSKSINNILKKQKLDNSKLVNIRIENQRLENPKLTNIKIIDPRLVHPKLANPRLANPRLANPRLANPRLANPRLANPRQIIPIKNEVDNLPIKLIKPFAILIHIYNAKYLSFFIKNIQILYSKYTKDSFDIFINIVYISNKVEIINNEKMIIDEEIKKLYKPNIIYNENKGGDIGGFLHLCKLLDLNKYNGIIFCHSKTKDRWRIDLCSSIFNYNFSNDELDFGLLGNSKWVHTVDPQKHQLNYSRFSEHFIKLFKIYNFDDYLELTINKKYTDIPKWQFIAGTMFIANIKIIKYIIDHDIDYVYSLLNKLETVDDNWLRIIKEMKLDNKGCGNDLCYRVKFGRPLFADFMIEHAFERLIGLICTKLNLTIKQDTFNTFQWGHSLF